MPLRPAGSRASTSRSKYPTGADRSCWLGESGTCAHDLQATIGDRHEEPKLASARITARKEAGPWANEIPCDGRSLHRVQSLRHRLKETSTEVPGASNRGGPFTINDGLAGEPRSRWHACTARRALSGGSVRWCFTTTADAVVLQLQGNLCAAAAIASYGASVARRTISKVGNLVRAPRWTNAHCAGGPEADNSKEEYDQIRLERCRRQADRLRRGCARPIAIAGDGAIIRAEILQGARGQARYSSGAWGWKTGYERTIAS